MNIESKSVIRVGQVEVLIWYKKVKNLHLSVLPPDGKVRVTAPVSMSEEAVRAFIASKLFWIKKHRQNFQEQPRQTKREYVSGESHYFLGQRYILEVEEKEGQPSVYIKNKKRIVLVCKPGSDVKKKKEIMRKWYKKNLTEFLIRKIPYWEEKIGVKTNSWKIRRMKTKWGSCNTVKKTINFNLELAKQSEASIEYVVVHELIHLIEPTHGAKFKKLLDKHFPMWRKYREELSKTVLLNFDDY